MLTNCMCADLLDGQELELYEVQLRRCGVGHGAQSCRPAWCVRLTSYPPAALTLTGTVLRYTDMSSLEHSISLAYIAASRRVFELFFDKFRLMDHLQALKDYLLFGKGDFVEILIEQLGPSLKRPANTLYRHNVTSALESAIRGSTPAGSAALSNVLQRLDARVLDSEQGLIGWDVFLLEYKVDAPLSTILDPASLDDYRALFRHLWTIKRVEYTLNECWRTLMTKMRLLKKGSGAQIPSFEARVRR